MPIVSPAGAISTGRDCTVVLIGPFGQIQIPNITGFEADQVTTGIRVERLNGDVINAELPKGWHGSLECDRGDNGLDVLVAAQEAAWVDGGRYVNSTMFQYVLEADGSTTTFAYDSVALKVSPGKFQPDSPVRQRVTFSANRRRIV